MGVLGNPWHTSKKHVEIVFLEAVRDPTMGKHRKWGNENHISSLFPDCFLLALCVFGETLLPSVSSPLSWGIFPDLIMCIVVSKPTHHLTWPSCLLSSPSECREMMVFTCWPDYHVTASCFVWWNEKTTSFLRWLRYSRTTVPKLFSSWLTN